MLTPWPMPCHITRLLALPALMMVAVTAATPSLPTIGSFCTTHQQDVDLEVLRIRGRGPARPVQALHQVEGADRAELRIKLAPRHHELADPVRGRPVE